MSELTRSQVRKLARIVNLVLKPEYYGCSLEVGDPATRDDRIGKIIDDAVGVLDDLQDPVPPAERGWFSGTSWRGYSQQWQKFPGTTPRGRVLKTLWSNSTPENN